MKDSGKRKNSDASIADELNLEDHEILEREESVPSQTTSGFNFKPKASAHSKPLSMQINLIEKFARQSNFSEACQSGLRSAFPASSTIQSSDKKLTYVIPSQSKGIKKALKGGSPSNGPPKKSPNKNSPRKRLWNKENDKILEEIEIQALEKVPVMTFIASAQSASTTNPTEFCQTFSLRRENKIDEIALRPAKRDYKVVRKALVNAVKYMKLLKLDPDEISNKKIFSSEPYEKENARELIQAVKMGDLTTVEILLLQNKYLVYDFDNIHQTALHWAAKRGHKEIAEALVQNGADLNVKDLLGRTPLFYAIQTNNIEILKILLKARCDPWSTDKVNYSELVRNKPLAKYYLSKCRQIHIAMAMSPTKQQNAVWVKESLVLAMDPINLPMTSTD